MTEFRRALIYVGGFFIGALIGIGIAQSGEIEGPTEVEAGETVVLKYPKEAGSSYRWLNAGGELTLYTFEEPPAKEETLKSVCVLGSSRSGTYLIQLVTSRCGAENEAPEIEILEKRIIIGDGGATPEPPATDPIVATVKELALVIGDKKTSLALASVFKLLSEGDHASIDELKKKTDALVSVTIPTAGGSLEKWKPFLVGLAAMLTELEKRGSLKDLDSHLEIWTKISTGLKRSGA